MQYHYDPLFLREVTRISFQDQPIYSYKYKEYELTGHLLSGSMIRELGSIDHKIALRGMQVSIESPYFSQKCHYDTKGNLIKSCVDKKNVTTYTILFLK